MIVPRPSRELERQTALQAYDILDTAEEQAYDDITALASHICGAPIALISFVDDSRQWFKSRIGLQIRETPREWAFCAHAVLEPSEVLIVPDAALDFRFAGNPLVTGDPHLRFYAGAPLVTPQGDALGTLCVLDRLPHVLDNTQVVALRALSRLVMAQLEQRRSSIDLTTRQRLSEQALQSAVDQRSLAQALQGETERRTRRIIDTALDAVVMIDQDQHITFWNAQAEVTFGWPAELAIGRPWVDLMMPAESRRAHTDGIRQYMVADPERALNQRIELTARHRDGREFPVELTITSIREDGVVTLSAFIRDISARRRSEQLLDTQYRVSQILGTAASVAEAAPSLLGTACEVLGWDIGALWLSDAAAGGLTCAELWLAPGLEGCEFAANTSAMVFAPGKGLPGLVFERGEPIWIQDIMADPAFPRGPAARAAGLRTGAALPASAAGTVRGVIEFFSRKIIPLDREVMNTLRSIATQVGQFFERREAEEAVHLSEARTRAVVDNMLEGLMVVGEDLRVLDANDAFARIFRYDRQAMIGMSVLDLMPDTPDYQDVTNLTARYRQSLGRATEHEGRRRNGEIFPLELQVYEIVTPEGVLTAAHARDLSQEREAERLKQQFVASVSHELRTPLTAIRGALGLLRSQAAGPLAEPAREMVNIADRNAARLLGIINDLLDFERLQLGLLSVTREPFSLDLAVERAIESVSPLAQDASITVVAPAGHVMAFGDEARVIQVLVNLLSNAIKFSPAGSRVEVSVQEEVDTARVVVRDEGRGVPATLRDAIFEPFRQVEGSDARRHRGSGLGLAICRALVRQHGGAIGVECPDTGGSAFWFTLPLRDDPPGLDHGRAT